MNTKKGFSLIELLISVAILAILMVAASGIFAKAFKSFTYNRSLQKDIQTAQSAMNQIAKELRTSSVASPSTSTTAISSVKFFEYSQSQCIRYRIQGGVLEVARQPAADLGTCQSMSGPSNYSALTTGAIQGNFRVTPSDGTSDPKVVGRMTITLILNDGQGGNIPIQNTSSLRDYGVTGIGT